MQRKTKTPECEAITRIIRRAMDIAHRHDIRVLQEDQAGLVMDIMGAHEVCPIRLGELADASDTDFIHDVLGIYKHFDRNTRTLTDGFVPRYAA